MKLSLQETLQQERRLRIQTEKEFHELKEKYEILLAKSNNQDTEHKEPTP